MNDLRKSIPLNPAELDPDRGVDFRPHEGERSTSKTGRHLLTTAVRRTDPLLEGRIASAKNWRADYLELMRDVVVAEARSPSAALSVANDALGVANTCFEFVRGGRTLSLMSAMDELRERTFETIEIVGTANRDSDFTLPLRGQRIGGERLRQQLDTWGRDGVAEPSAVSALYRVIDDPEQINLDGVHVAVLGAGAEMGPIRSLLRWGATVYAVDLPRPELWSKLIAYARGSAGRLRIPVPVGSFGNREPDDTEVAYVAGADLITSAPEIRTWLNDITVPFTLGTYAYADGATHVRVTMAADAICADLLATRGDIALAYLATPTDAFAVPMNCVHEARSRWDERGAAGWAQVPLRLLGQFEPNYPSIVVGEDGREFGIADCLVGQQGPNYALAKRLQRWRALSARAAGTRTSINVAPATRTRSVLKNRALGAAYAGAHRFGIEVFDPSTSNTLMAALLVYDLRDESSSANPAQAMTHPLNQLMDGSIHGGLWRVAYQPRSVLGIAALLGMFNRRS